MHMPMKLRVIVLVTVAACVASFYVFVVMPERVGAWRIYQGSGRMERESKGGERFLDVKYRVAQAGKPLFSYLAMTAAPSDNDGLAMLINYQSEQRAALVAEVSEWDGTAWQARLELEPTDKWTQRVLRRQDFKPRGVPHPGDESRALRFDRLATRVDFYDDTSVKAPTTVFENRLKLTPPVVARPPDDEHAP